MIAGLSALFTAVVLLPASPGARTASLGTAACISRTKACIMGKTDDRLAELGITLPAAPAPLASYVPCVRSGNMLYLSGSVPFKEDGTLHAGKVSVEYSLEQAQACARTVGLQLIATLKANSDLDKVRVVKLVGFVNSPPDFYQQPEVINACSDLMVEVFGKERGTHARSALGTNSLPFQVPVEIELIVEVDD